MSPSHNTNLEVDESSEIRPATTRQSLPGEESVQAAAGYDDMMDDVGNQARVEFKDAASERVQDVFIKILAEVIEGLEYATNPDVNTLMKKR